MTHGDAGWDAYGSYLDVAGAHRARVPRRPQPAHHVLRRRPGRRARPATRSRSGRSPTPATRSATTRFRHQPWLHRYSLEEIDDELRPGRGGHLDVTGQRTVGLPWPRLQPLRGRAAGAGRPRLPLRLLDAAHGHRAARPQVLLPHAPSSPPSSARSAATCSAAAEEGLRPLKPYQWQVGADRLLEIPVTTMPLPGCRST